MAGHAESLCFRHPIARQPPISSDTDEALATFRVPSYVLQVADKSSGGVRTEAYSARSVRDMQLPEPAHTRGDSLTHATSRPSTAALEMFTPSFIPSTG